MSLLSNILCRWSLVCIAMLAGSILLADAVRENRQYDFSSVPKDVELGAGWRVADGVLKYPEIKSGKPVVFGTYQWRDYELEFKVRRLEAPKNGQHWGFFLQYGSNRPIQLYSRGNSLICLDGEFHQQMGSRFKEPLPLGKDAAWTQFNVSVHGNRIEVKMNGEVIAVYDAPERRSGKVAFYSLNVAYEIDDMRFFVYEPAPTISAKNNKKEDTGNLLFNSGFEQSTQEGLPDYWGCPHWGICDTAAILNPDRWRENFGIDTHDPFEGKNCLRINNPNKGEPPLSLRIRSCNVRSKSGVKYTLSAWLKSSVDGQKVRLGNEAVTVTTSWKRYAVEFVNDGKSLYHDMIDLYPESGGTLWIDAVQLEPGDMTDYRPIGAERQLLVHDGNAEKKFYDVPEYRLPFRKDKIVLDGKLEERVWNDLKPLPIQTVLNKPAEKKTEARLWADDRGIYAGIKCHGQTAQGTVKERDGWFWNDPTVELFIDSKYSRTFYYHLAVTKNNVQYDSFCLQPNWNGRWKSATYIAPDNSFWSAEIFIPFGMLGIGRDYQENWGFNLGRSDAHASEALSWAPTYGSFHAPLRFGNLLVNPELQKQYLFRIADVKLQRVDEKHLVLSATAANDGEPAAELTFTASSGKSEFKKQIALAPGEQKQVELGRIEVTGNTTAVPVSFELEEKGVLRFSEQRTLPVLPVFDAQIQFGVTDSDRLPLQSTVELPENIARKTSVRVTLNGSGELNLPVKAGKAETLLNLAGLEPGKFQVDVELVNSNGEVLASRKLSGIRIAPNAHSVLPDRFNRMVRVNGKPFFPLGFSLEGLIDPAVIAAYAKTGCNVIGVMGGYIQKRDPELKKLRQILDEAQKHNLMVRVWVDGRDPDKSAEIVNAFKDHPALLCWDVFDEIFTVQWGQQNYPAVLANVAKIKAMDPAHPVFINENDWGMKYVINRNWQFPGDIVSIDHYTFPPQKNLLVYKDVLADMNALGNTDCRPNWIYLLGAGYAFHASRDHTPAEHRYMAYSCVIHGASGIFYFADYPKSRSSLWAIQQNFQDFKALTPVLASTEDVPKVTCNAPEVEFTVRHHDNALWVIAVNSSEGKKIPARFLFDGYRGNEVVAVPFENRQLQSKNGLFEDVFKGYEPHVYKIVPAQ